MTRTIDGTPYHLNLTDTAGQEEYRSLWATSNLRSDAFLLVYDITNASSLDNLDHFNELIDMEAEHRLDSGSPPPPVKLVAGNKCDLQGQRVVGAQRGLEWARRRGCGFMETSARDMVNVEETFARRLSPRAGGELCGGWVDGKSTQLTVGYSVGAKSRRGAAGGGDGDGWRAV